MAFEMDPNQEGSFGDYANTALDPANVFGAKDSSIESYETSPYQYDPSYFQLGTENLGWDANQGGFSGGLGGWALDQYGNRQIDPAMEAMLRDAASGGAPSVAEMQMRAGMERAQKMAMGIAMSNPNISPAMAMRLAMNAQNEMQLQTNQQSGMLRAAEMQQARGDLSKYLMEQRSQNDAMIRYFMSLGYTMDEAQLKANMALEELRGQQHMAAEDRRLAATQGETAVQQQRWGATASVVGAIMGGGAGSYSSAADAEGSGNSGGGEGGGEAETWIV